MNSGASRLRSVMDGELEDLRASARTDLRRRVNLNLHPALDDPVQRLFNALEPGTYVRPHRHAPGRWETFVLLTGAVGVLIFEDDGSITETLRVGREGARAVEIPGGVWHSLVVLAGGTTLFEVKPGPYDAATDKEFAPWSPCEDGPRAAALLAVWERAVGVSGPTG